MAQLEISPQKFRQILGSEHPFLFEKKSDFKEVEKLNIENGLDRLDILNEEPNLI